MKIDNKCALKIKEATEKKRKENGYSEKTTEMIINSIYQHLNKKEIV